MCGGVELEHSCVRWNEDAPSLFPLLFLSFLSLLYHIPHHAHTAAAHSKCIEGVGKKFDGMREAGLCTELRWKIKYSLC